MSTASVLALLAVLAAGSASAAEPIPAQEFVNRAAKLGAAELAAAKLAEERSESEAVKKFANRMIVDHTVAQDELSKIAAAKGWTIPQPAAEPPELAKLRTASGAEFDAAYVELQIRGHEEMIALLEAQAEASPDARLEEYAAKQLPIVREHLGEAKGLRDSDADADAAAHHHH